MGKIIFSKAERLTLPGVLVSLLLLLTACSTVLVSDQRLFEGGYAAMADKARLALTTPAYKPESVSFFGIDGVQLHGLLITNPDARLTLVYFGRENFQVGTGGLATGRAFEALDVNVLLVDYRGSGESKGTASLPDVKSDALSAYDYLSSRKALSHTTLVPYGVGIGSFIAAYVATQRPVGGLVLEDPGVTAAALIRDRLPWYSRFSGNLKISPRLQDENNATYLKVYKGPLLIFATSENDTTSSTDARTLEAVAGTPATMKFLHVVDQAQPGQVLEDPSARIVLKAFFDKYVLGKDHKPDGT